MPTEKQMPRYQCVREVFALKISKVVVTGECGGLLFTEKDFMPIEVPYQFMVTQNPSVGSYYVFEKGRRYCVPADEFNREFRKL